MDINSEKDKFGFLYFIKIEGTKYENLYKIGITWRTVAKRKNELIKGAPFLKYTLVSFLKFHNCRYFEKRLHDMLAKYRVAGEYFDVEESIIDENLEKMASEYIDATPNEIEIPLTSEQLARSKSRMNDGFKESGMSLKDWIAKNIEEWSTHGI